MTDKKSPSPVLPWKLRFTLSALTAVTDFSRRSNGTVNRRLLGLVQSTSKVRPRTSDGVKVSDVTVDSTRDLWFRLFVPTDISVHPKLPVLVFFHGGGFSFFSPDMKEYDNLCRGFARNIPVIVVSVNYRLAPEHRYPAPYDDGFDTLKFLDQKTFDDFPANADLSRCFIAGDSAGGNIAHHVVRRVAGRASEFSELKVVGLISMQAFFGGEERTESEIRLIGVPLISIDRTDWHWKAFLPEGEDRDHEAVNVFGPKSSDISGLESFPATLVFVGGFDPLQDWQKHYYEGLKRAGKQARLIEYPNAIHAFYIFPELPELSLFLEELTNFIQSNGDINYRMIPKQNEE